MALGIVIELDTGALLLYGIPFIIVVGWFSSRLLGVHRGWGRSLVAGFTGWILGVTIAALVEDQNIKNTHQLNKVLPLAFFFGLLDLDVRRAVPRRAAEAEGAEASPVRPAPAPDQNREAEGRTARALARDPAVRARSAGSRTTPRRRSWRRPSSLAACASRSRTAAACS